MWAWGPSKILRVKGMARQGSSDGLNETTTAAESPSAPACRVHNHSSTSSHQGSPWTRQLAFAAELRRAWLVGTPQDDTDGLLAVAGSMEDRRDDEDEDVDGRTGGRRAGTKVGMAAEVSSWQSCLVILECLPIPGGAPKNS